jgi:hypothetical protein
MPDKKISQLNTAGTLTGNEELPLVQSGSTFKVLLSSISNYIRSLTTLQKVTDAGNTTTNSINVDAVKFSLTPTNSPATGQIAYIGNTGALSYLMNNSVMSSIGQTLHAYVHNADSVTITKGQPVYLFSASGNKASVKLAYNTGDSTSAKTLGLASENITAGQTGFITCQGVLDGLNTGSYTAGDSLYLGATAGALTNSKPYAPNHLVYIGMVERANNGNGQIYVRVQNGYELDEIHDCYINPTTLSNNDVLQYDSASSLWKNKQSNYLQIVSKDITDSTALTGTTAITLMKSVLIPANTFATGDVVKILSRAIRNTATGSANNLFYLNTTNTLTGATLLATQTSTSIFFGMERSIYIKSATNSETIIPTNSSSGSEVGVSVLGVSNLNINWGVNQYIIAAFQNAAVGNSTVMSSLIIQKF